MLRKLILQLPHAGNFDEIPEPTILEQYGVHYDNVTKSFLLKSFEVWDEMEGQFLNPQS